MLVKEPFYRGGMRRPVGGLVVLAAACLVVAIATTHGGPGVAGSPDLPAGAVAAGMCIGPVDQPSDHPVAPGVGAGEQIRNTATYSYPVATPTSCDQPHAGTVLTVDYQATSPRAATLPVFASLDAACQSRVDTLLATRGLTQFTDRQPSGIIAWNPALQLAGRAVGPNQQNRTAGQHWSGCAMVAADGTLWRPQDAAPGWCLSVDAIGRLATLDASGGMLIEDPSVHVNCFLPHPAQIITFAGSVGGTPGAQDVRKSCVDAAAHFIGTADPQHHGALAVEVIDDNYPICFIRTTDDRQLGGSLLGLGDTPLPWSI